MPECISFPHPDRPAHATQGKRTQVRTFVIHEALKEQRTETYNRRVLGFAPWEITLLLIGGPTFSALAAAVKVLLTVPSPS